MRNLILQTLPPNSELVLDIEPPMDLDERHYLLSPPSPKPVVVRVIDDAHISITNPDDSPVFFILAIAPVMRLPSGVHEALSAFFAARKNPS